MKKFSTALFLAAAAFGFAATDLPQVATPVTVAADDDGEKISPATEKARATLASYNAYRARKKGFGNLNKRWVQYLDEAKKDVPPLVKSIDTIGKEDKAAAMHVVWVYDELLDRGEEPVEGTDIRKITEKYDFARFVRKYANEEELNAVSPAKTKEYLQFFQQAANRLGEDSVWEKAQERAKKAE
jgi:hypothetical protein